MAASKNPENNNYDLGLLPDPEVARQLGVTLMTLWRWDHEEKYRELEFPKRIKISTRNYRSAKELTAWRDRMVRKATTTLKKAGAR